MLSFLKIPGPTHMTKQQEKHRLLSKLFSINAICWRDDPPFKLKSGRMSNLYCDMRSIIAFPSIFHHLYNCVMLEHPSLFSDVLCLVGVEYGGIPFANYVSHKLGISQLHVRDVAKTHGTQQVMEGSAGLHMRLMRDSAESSSTNNTPILLIEDVITTGGSVVKKAQQIESMRRALPSNMYIKGIFTIIDRRQPYDDTTTILYPVFSLFTENDICSFGSMFTSSPIPPLFYYDAPLENEIFARCIQKKTALIVACDLNYAKDVLSLIDRIGPHVLGVKLHINILCDFTPEFIHELLELKQRHGLFIIEDGKYADIGAIVAQQLSGLYKVGEWADIITAHAITGDGLAFAVEKDFPKLGILLISELSSTNNLITEEYTKRVVRMAQDHANVIGFISQHATLKHIGSDRLTFSPGINLNPEICGDGRDQTYGNGRNSGMFWIVGRAIYDHDTADAVLSACRRYSLHSWQHFLEMM